MLSRVEIIKLLWLSVEEGREILREKNILKSKSMKSRKMLEYCVLEGKKDISFTKVVKNVF